MLINQSVEPQGLLSKLREQTKSLQESSQKLSSGYRINTAADDAANLAVSEKLWAQISGQSKAMQNIQDGISFVGTGEGAMGEIHSMLNRMQELAVQAANGTLGGTERGILNDELNALKSEVNRIAQSTNFNGHVMLDGSMDEAAGGEAFSLQVGDSANGFDQIDVNIRSMMTDSLGLDNVNFNSASSAMDALSAIRNAVNQVSEERGALGALENRLDSAYSSLSVTNENLLASQSRIKDTDMAREWMNYSRLSLLGQAQSAVMAQSNLQAAQVMQLLR